MGRLGDPLEQLDTLFTAHHVLRAKSRVTSRISSRLTGGRVSRRYSHTCATAATAPPTAHTPRQLIQPSSTSSVDSALRAVRPARRAQSGRGAGRGHVLEHTQYQRQRRGDEQRADEEHQRGAGGRPRVALVRLKLVAVAEPPPQLRKTRVGRFRAREHDGQPARARPALRVLDDERVGQQVELHVADRGEVDGDRERAEQLVEVAPAFGGRDHFRFRRSGQRRGEQLVEREDDERVRFCFRVRPYSSARAPGRVVSSVLAFTTGMRGRGSGERTGRGRVAPLERVARGNEGGSNPRGRAAGNRRQKSLPQIDTDDTE